ncbi:hypothetical protein C7451_11682 [Blastomonas natatoria]|uniref:Uncharacterized protein n=2 Tax=Blastomonas natatoria TaxID=34015 RepID=A0A2V3UQA7_9SPHN|nr:hypothetical protein C7451_11682 [Blastomonas natatoria]
MRMRGLVGMRMMAVAAVALMLTGCLLFPGKFAADMTVMRGGGFSFAYKGDIHLLGLSQLIAMGAALDDKGAEFTPGPCYGEPAEVDAAVLKTAFAQDEEGWAEEALERECTPSEIETQKQAWDDQRAAKKAEDAKNIEIAKALLGGIDPTSPDAIDEFIVRIKKQKGWREVIHKGDGLFSVDYAVSGRIDQDYSFPTIERVQGISPFVVATARTNNAVRIDAPAFIGAGQSSLLGGNMGGLMSLFAAIGASSDGPEGKLLASMPKAEGSFTIRTDGEILTNNTEDGPSGSGALRVLEWKVNARRDRAPEALIMLNPA